MTATTEEKKRYLKAWAEHRKRQRWAFAFLLTFVPAMLLFGAIPQELGGSGAFGALTAMVWLPAILVSGLRLACWRCPRCGRFFHWSWLATSPLNSRCLHCGLVKNASADEAAS